MLGSWGSVKLQDLVFEQLFKHPKVLRRVILSRKAMYFLEVCWTEYLSEPCGSQVHVYLVSNPHKLEVA